MDSTVQLIDISANEPFRGFAAPFSPITSTTSRSIVTSSRAVMTRIRPRELRVATSASG
jgi:hypothetical protein